MPLYFFDIQSSDGGIAHDFDGSEFAVLDEAVASATESGREILSEDIKFASENSLEAVIIKTETGEEIRRITAKELLPQSLR